MSLTAQETIFMQRVTAKMVAGERDIERAMQAVLDDDARILNTYFNKLQPDARAELDAMMCEQVYKSIMGGQDVTKEYDDEHEFNTRAEAEAFKLGVEYVNDSALTVTSIRKRGGKFYARTQDKDKKP